MRLGLQFRVLAVMGILILMLVPTAFLFANCVSFSSKHDCCGGSDGFRPASTPQQCCVISASDSSQPLVASSTSPSVAQPAAGEQVTLAEVSTRRIVLLPDNVTPSPPRCSSVLRI